jgi:serine/threonine-protein kinase
MSADRPRPTLSGLEYRVVKSLGTGAGSTILQIADKQMGKNYALKVVKRQQPSDDVYIEQARTEFAVSQRLNHPNLLEIYDLRLRRAWFRLSAAEELMEYVDGRPLDEYESLSMKRLILVFLDVASGLEHMHRRGIYHGDLKPGNILLSRTKQVKVIDFGTAWLRGQEKNRVQGTLQYMAPEQATKKIVDDKTDIYNYGATLYRLLTGQYANAGGVPQQADGVMGALMRPKNVVEYNDKVPTELSRIVMACIEPNPGKRPPDFGAIRDRLIAVARKYGVPVDEAPSLD